MKKEIGLTGTALKWLKSYFSGRTTSVCISGTMSVNHDLDYGLSQGSTVGPLSFSVYTMPIGRIIQHHGLSYHLYADDVQIYTCFEPSNQTFHCVCPGHDYLLFINDIRSLTRNMLKLNNDQTEFFVALSSYNKHRMPLVTLQIVLRLSCHLRT